MKLTDLTPAYRAHYLERDDRTAYEAAAPALFDHYYANWADIAKPPVRLSESELATNRQYLLNSLSRIEPALRNFGVQPESLELALIVGQDSSNGHAYREQDRFLPCGWRSNVTAPQHWLISLSLMNSFMPCIIKRRQLSTLHIGSRKIIV